MATVNRIIKLLIQADATGVRPGVDAATQSLTRLGDVAGRVRGVLAGLGVSLSLTGVALGIRNALRVADELGKAAESVGMTTEALSALDFAARQSGLSQENLRNALARLSKQMSDAAQGIGNAGAAFTRLGVAVRDQAGNLRSTDVVFRDLAQAFSELPTGAEKTALAMRVFGEEVGRRLIPLLNQGADGLAKLEQAARDMGLVMDQETADAAQRVNDSLDNIGRSANRVWLTLAERILPTLESVTGAMARGARQGGILGAVWEGLARSAERLSNARRGGSDLPGADGQTAAAFAGSDNAGSLAAFQKQLQDTAAALANPPPADGLLPGTEAQAAATLDAVTKLNEAIGKLQTGSAPAATTLDFFDAISAVQTARGAGDIDTAVAQADQARQVIEQLAKAGDTSEFVLAGLKSQLAGLGQELAQQAGAEPVSIDTTLDAAGEYERLQAEFAAQNPIIIKARFDVAMPEGITRGDGSTAPYADPLADGLSSEALKRGSR